MHTSARSIQSLQVYILMDSEKNLKLMKIELFYLNLRLYMMLICFIKSVECC